MGTTSTSTVDVELASGPSGGGSGLRGALWTIGGFGAGQVLRFASNLVLTRLLFPEAFGIMSLLFLFTQALALFSDVGSGPAIVQSPRGEDPRFLNTAWTVEIVRGGVLWMGTWLIARPIANFYGQPLLAAMLPVAGLMAVMDGFRAKSFELALRHVRLGRMNLVELTSQAATVVAMILFALAHRAAYGPKHPAAAWALLGGVLVGGLTKSVLSHVAMPGIRHRLHIDRESLKALFSFGRWTFISTALSFLAAQSDRLIFGKTIPLDLFGLYGLATTLALVPNQVISAVSNRVLFPVLSRAAPRDFGHTFWRARMPLLVGAAALTSLLIASGPFLVGVLYDSRYVRAGWILQFMAVAAWFQTLEYTVVAALMAQASLRWVAVGNATKLAALVGFVSLGFRLGGFPGALVGFILSDLVKYSVAMFAAAKRGIHVTTRDLGLSLLLGLTSFLGLVAGRAVYSAREAYLLGLLTAGLVSVTPWAVLGWWTVRRYMAHKRHLARATASRTA